jgi:ABC-type sugar transport system substrate-binding protein
MSICSRVNPRAAALGCACLAALAFAACGSESSGGDASSGAAGDDATKRFKLAGVVMGNSDPFYATMACGAKAEAERQGADLNWQGPADFDQNKLISAFNSVKVTKPDGIILSPFSPTALASAVKTLMADGTPVVLADGELEGDVALQAFRTDTLEAGKALTDIVGEAMGGKGSLGIVAFAPANPIDEARYKGFTETLTAAHPDIKVLEPQYAQASTTKAASVASALMRANPELTAIYATNGPQAAGVASAIKAAGRDGKVKLFAFDATPEEADALRAGEIEALVAQSPQAIGEMSVKATVDYLKANADGGAVAPEAENWVKTPHKVITKADVDSPEAAEFLYKASCDA